MFILQPTLLRLSRFRPAAARLPWLGLTWLLLPRLLQGRLHVGVLREGHGGSGQLGLLLDAAAWLAQPQVLEAALGETRLSLLLSVREAERAPTAARQLVGAGHEPLLRLEAGRAAGVQRAALEAVLGVPVTLALPAAYWPWTLWQLRQAGLRAVQLGTGGDLAELLEQAEPGSILNLERADSPGMDRAAGHPAGTRLPPRPAGHAGGPADRDAARAAPASLPPRLRRFL